MHIGTSTTGPVSEEDVLAAAADVGLKKEQLRSKLELAVALLLRLQICFMQRFEGHPVYQCYP